MAALMAFLGVIGFVAILMWRLSLGIRAARDIHAVAKQVVNSPRKKKAISISNAPNLQQISDPREAAVVLMLFVARAGGKITRVQKDTIINQITGRFDIPTVQAEKLLSHVSWLSKDLPEASSIVPKMSKIIQQSVSSKELIELEDMLMQIAHIKGEPNEEQKKILNKFALLVGI